MHLTSNDFADGDYLGAAHVLSAEYGFGCAGENQSPPRRKVVDHAIHFDRHRSDCVGVRQISALPSTVMQTASS